MNKTYRETIAPHAATLFAASGRTPGIEMFVTLRVGGAYGPVVNDHGDIDLAAEDTNDDAKLGRYFGTIHVGTDGKLVWLDLRDHGHALAREAEADETEERAHERGLSQGAGRIVL